MPVTDGPGPFEIWAGPIAEMGYAGYRSGLLQFDDGPPHRCKGLPQSLHGPAHVFCPIGRIHGNLIG